LESCAFPRHAVENGACLLLIRPGFCLDRTERDPRLKSPVADRRYKVFLRTMNLTA